MQENVCHECKEEKPSSNLRRCPVCHRRFCDEHAYHMSGRPFCSSGCAQMFFFDEPDD